MLEQQLIYAQTDLKANALLKLLYLEMFGHDMSWASFQVLEVMSSTNPEQKRIGYLGAIQTFRPNTDVLLLATNLLKKVNHSCDYQRLNRGSDGPLGFVGLINQYLLSSFACTSSSRNAVPIVIATSRRIA